MNVGQKGDRGERGKDGRGAYFWVPTTTAVLLGLVLIFQIVGSQREQRHFDNIQAANIARDKTIGNLSRANHTQIKENERARRNSFKAGCRYQNGVVGTMLWGFQSRTEDGEDIASRNLGIRNCAASFQKGENVFLDEREKMFAIEEISENGRLPIFNAQGEFTHYLSLPELDPVRDKP